MKLFIVRYKFVLVGAALAIVALIVVTVWLTRSSQVAEQPLVEVYPTDAWQTSTPEEQGMDSSKAAQGILAISQNGTKIHSLLLIRHAAKVLDAYFYPYDGTNYHDVASVSKSIMTTMIGIAIDQGKLSLDQTVLSFFPERTIVNLDKNKKSITIRDLVSMSAGWDCGADNEATAQEMRRSPDWTQFILDRRMVSKPGTQFSYCNLSMHMLSIILQKATGMTALEFGRSYLFSPLGIQQVYWPSDNEGHSIGWGDIALYPEDMARIGFLFLHDGRWQGKQIISADWVHQATSKHISTPSMYGEDYGFGWWVSKPGADIAAFSAQGREGQRILVVPSLDLVEVTTGGGFEMSEIDPYLLAAITDLQNPIPANPTGVEQLEAAVAEIVKAPQAQAVPPLPSLASQVTGRTYQLEQNDYGMVSTRVDFTSPDQATFWLEVIGDPVVRMGNVGLDGLYRSSLEGRPWLARGEWLDDQTFMIEYDEGPGLSLYLIYLKFENNKLTLELKDAANTSLGVTAGSSD